MSAFAEIMIALCLLTPVNNDDSLLNENWPSWRGPTGNGVAPHANPPVRWSETENLLWKKDLPGHGSSSPIVWEERIFVMWAKGSARKATQKEMDEKTRNPDQKTEPPSEFYHFGVTCLDRETGRVLWEKIAVEALPHEGHHSTHGFASASPVTDGKRLYAFFGSHGLFAFGFDGTPLWSQDLGDMLTRYGWGEGASPSLYEGCIVVPWDHEGQSSLALLDSENGDVLWRVNRDERSTWFTPLIATDGHGTQIVTTGQTMRSYDFETGELLWEREGLSLNAIPSPVLFEDIAICMSGYQKQAAFAIQLSSRGDLTESKKEAWAYGQGTPYVPSPLLSSHRLYFTRGNTATLTCVDARNGKPIYEPERIPELHHLYASPVAAAGRIYITDRDGNTAVIRDGDKFEVLGTNSISGFVDATPAIVGNDIVIRSQDAIFVFRDESGS